MGRKAVLLVLLMFGLLLGGVPGPLRAADVANRTFDAPLDRVWTVAESVLKSLGWEIDTSDRAVGWILTDARGLDSKEYAVYGKGLRHKLRLSLKAVGESRTTVTVDRELYTEKRVLWMAERKPVPATEQTVEAEILAAIARGL